MHPKKLFGIEEHLERLSCKFDRLEQFAETIDFEYFCAHLMEGLAMAKGHEGAPSV